MSTVLPTARSGLLANLAAGTSSPLGATPGPDGVNFSVYSSRATGVELLLFAHANDSSAARVIRINPATNRTYHYWHVFVPGVSAGQIYGYRVEGPRDPARGMLFDPTKILLDPYGRAVGVPDNYRRTAASEAGDNGATAMKSIVVDTTTYDWEGDTPLRLPSARTIIYETHVRGFTQHPSSEIAEEKRGTFAGLIEKVPYLRQLGITAVELLPVFQFDAQACPPGKVNYWGYQPISFFAPAPSVQFSSGPARVGGRVPRHGQSTTLRWHRGDPRCCIQSYCRGRPYRANTVFPRVRQSDLLHPRR